MERLEIGQGFKWLVILLCLKSLLLTNLFDLRSSLRILREVRFLVDFDPVDKLAKHIIAWHGITKTLKMKVKRSLVLVTFPNKKANVFEDLLEIVSD